MGNIEKIRQEIEFLKELNEGLYTEGDNSYYEGHDNACNHILAFIDSLPEENLSYVTDSPGDPGHPGEPGISDLEEAADEYSEKHGFRVPYDGSNNFYDEVDVKSSKEGFIAGAKWMESQMPMPEDTVIFMKGVAEGRRLEREDKNDDNLPRITDEDFKRAVRDEYAIFVDGDPVYSKLVNQVVGLGIAKHFADLGVKWVKEEKSSKDNELPRYYGD